MQLLNLPSFDYKIQSSEAGPKIFDVVRKKYVQLTSEEWVRQHFLHYLIGHLAYPRTLVRLEQIIQHNQLRHRPDIVVYNRLAGPLMLVECKAPHIDITHEAWEQIARYNAYFDAQLLVITNGVEHFCWRLDYEKGDHVFLPTVPRFGASF